MVDVTNLKLTVALVMLAAVALSNASQNDIVDLDVADACTDYWMSYYAKLDASSNVVFRIKNGQQQLGDGLYKVTRFKGWDKLPEDRKKNESKEHYEARVSQWLPYVFFESVNEKDKSTLDVFVTHAKFAEPAADENRVRAPGQYDVLWDITLPSQKDVVVEVQEPVREYCPVGKRTCVIL